MEEKVGEVVKREVGWAVEVCMEGLRHGGVAVDALQGLPRFVTTWEKGKKDGWLQSVGDSLWDLIKGSCPESQRHQLNVQAEWHGA